MLRFDPRPKRSRSRPHASLCTSRSSYRGRRFPGSRPALASPPACRRSPVGPCSNRRARIINRERSHFGRTDAARACPPDGPSALMPEQSLPWIACFHPLRADPRPHWCSGPGTTPGGIHRIGRILDVIARIDLLVGGAWIQRQRRQMSSVIHVRDRHTKIRPRQQSPLSRHYCAPSAV